MVVDQSDKTHFVTELSLFGTVHRITVSKELRDAYWDALHTMSRADFDVASTYLKQHSEWFPKPAAFFAAAKRGWV